MGHQHSAATGKTFEDRSAIPRRWNGPFKKDVGAALVEMLEPIQAEYHRIRADRAYMDAVMKASWKSLWACCSNTEKACKR